jgi:hypothetical protein
LPVPVYVIAESLHAGFCRVLGIRWMTPDFEEVLMLSPSR